jgi:hypothetical protein
VPGGAEVTGPGPGPGPGPAGVGVHTLATDGRPLLVADLPPGPAGAALVATLTAAGLVAVPGFLGLDLPRGAGVGIQLEGRDARLVDARDQALLRLPRAGLSAAWQEAAIRLRGTVLAVAQGLGVGPDAAPPALGAALETTARDGRLLCAIVGVEDRLPRLPLLF